MDGEVEAGGDGFGQGNSALEQAQGQN
jgi:hypothetical protein